MLVTIVHESLSLINVLLSYSDYKVIKVFMIYLVIIILPSLTLSKYQMILHNKYTIIQVFICKLKAKNVVCCINIRMEYFV